MTLRKASLLILAISTFAFAAPVTSKAATITYFASLDGPSEPTASLGIGTATVIIDDVLNTMQVLANFSGLTGVTTVSHIHCCTAVAGAGTAGVATVTPTFIAFPSGVKAGSYDRTYGLNDLATYNPAFVTAHGGTVATARADLLAGLDLGRAYFNIHSDVFPGGEIRGFLVAVPSPLVGAGLPGLVIAFGGLLMWWRRRRVLA